MHIFGNKMKVDFINSSYRRFYKSHKKEIDKAIQRCLERGELTLRQEVVDLERKLADFIGVKYALGLNSGTDALFLALKALGIKEGDEVITVSHTFIATLQAIVHCGAKPILVDIGLDELMNVNEIENKITRKTKAVIPVHYTGKVCNMSVIQKIAKKYNLFIVEDACQALGAKMNNKMAGSFGDIGCFSFNTAKLMGCYGDGGAVVLNNKKLYKRIALLRNHWNLSQLSVKKEDFPQPKYVEWGWKSRLDNIQAAVLLVKFKYLKKNLQRRAEIAKMYYENLKDIVNVPEIQPGQVWQEYHIRVENRKAFCEFMKKNGIELLVRDKIPNHKLKYLHLDHFHLPITESFAKEIVRLPLYPEMTNNEVKYVIQKTREFFEKQKNSCYRSGRKHRKSTFKKTL